MHDKDAQARSGGQAVRGRCVQDTDVRMRQSTVSCTDRDDAPGTVLPDGRMTQASGSREKAEWNLA